MPRKKALEQPITIGGETPGFSAEAREDDLINAAFNLAEQRIRDGTASDSLITQFLKMGSRRSRVELETKELEKQLIQAKTEAMNAQRHSDELFSNAIAAMQRYRIVETDEEDDENVYGAF